MSRAIKTPDPSPPKPHRLAYAARSDRGNPDERGRLTVLASGGFLDWLGMTAGCDCGDATPTFVFTRERSDRGNPDDRGRLNVTAGCARRDDGPPPLRILGQP